MTMIDIHNISKVLGQRGVKFCSGLGGKKCFRPRREKQRYCLGCHRDSMREMRKKGGGRVSDGYDFSQENYV